MNNSVVEACPECDLLQSVPQHEGTAHCARCDARLDDGEGADPVRDAALSATLLILLGIANAFPILRLELNGRQQNATVFDGVLAMWDEQRYELAALILAVAVLFPIAHALSTLVRSYLIIHGDRRAAASRWALWSVWLAPWGMTEVYLLGALVAFVKLDDLATVVVGPALFAFALLSVLTAWSATHNAGLWSLLRSA